MKVVGKAISGAQTGVDVGALRAPRSRGVPTGGTVPRGYKTNRGPMPEQAQEFGLVEHERADYPSRTRANVAAADVTVRIAHNFMSAGERCTLRACLDEGRPVLDVHVRRVGGELVADREDLVQVVARLTALSLAFGRPLVVNFAGNSEETCRGIEALAERTVGLLLDALSEGV